MTIYKYMENNVIIEMHRKLFFYLKRLEMML